MDMSSLLLLLLLVSACSLSDCEEDTPREEECCEECELMEYIIYYRYFNISLFFWGALFILFSSVSSCLFKRGSSLRGDAAEWA